VNWAKGLGILSLSALLGMPAAAQRKPEGPPARFRVVAQGNAQKNPNRPNRGGQRPGQRMGNLLNLPPDQREKALENDPGFKNLPPDRQAALRERLRKFNNMTPQQQERVRERMRFVAGLTDEQQRQLRQANQQLQGLPQDRQIMVHKALRHLRQMDPQERQQVLNSDRFKSTFSEDERGILTRLSAIPNPPEGGEEPSPQPNGPPK
jgi:Protein of unknown function (DUF3106)